jgi:hypothetical protein
MKTSVSFPSGLDPEKAFSAVMCALSSRLGSGKAVEFLDSAIVDLRPLVQRCETHREQDLELSQSEEPFYQVVAEHLKISESEAVDVTHTVVQSFHDWIPARELKEMEDELSRDLKPIRRAA